MVRGRLMKINDRPVNLNDYPDPRAKQLVNREFNLSWTDTLQSDNEIVAGRWWREEIISSEHELSMEVEFAETLGLKMGDRLTFIQEEEISQRRLRVCARWIGIHST